MKIGIIGAGFIGRGLASLAGKSDHEVMISNSRAPRTLGSTAVALRCQVGTAADAAAFGEVVMVAIPFYAIDSLPADALKGKIVVDANNYYPERDGAIAELDRNETTTSEMLARHLAGARVVKAFNAILQRDLEWTVVPRARPTGARCRSLATMPRLSESSPACWTSLDTTRSMPGRWPKAGGSSVPSRRIASG